MARSTGGAGLASTPSGTKIPKPAAASNPLWRQAAGKSWDPGSAVPKGQPLPPAATVQPGSPAPVAPYSPAHSVTTTVTPPPPNLSGNNWQGYLTPDQLQNLYTASDQYASGVAQYGPGGAFLQNAQADYNQATQQAQHEHDVQQSQHAQQLAARGMLQSGIAASDFADLDRSLTIRQSGAQSSLNASILGAQNAIDSLGRVWGHAQSVGQGQAAIDAAGMAQYQPYQQTTQVPASGSPPPAPGVAPPPAGAPPNPFWGQAAGKPWNPAAPKPGAGPSRPVTAKPKLPSFKSSAPKRVK